MSPEEAKQVISRALEIQDASDGRPGEGLTLGDVSDIARQVGVDPSVIPRALAEVRRATAMSVEPSRTERLLGPARMTGATVLPLEAEAARNAVSRWMSEDEGMRLTGARAGAERWMKDPRLLVGIRRGLGVTRAEGVLRDLREVVVSVEDGPAGTVVALDADTKSIRQTSASIMAVGAAGGVVGGLINAAVMPETALIGADLGQFAVTWAMFAAAGVGVASTVRRAWTQKVRTAIDAALDGISLRASRPGAELPAEQPTGWRQTALRWLGGDR